MAGFYNHDVLLISAPADLVSWLAISQHDSVSLQGSQCFDLI